MEAPRYEFWMQDYPSPGQNNSIYRVALGELIPSNEREIYRPQGNFEGANKTGSIGYMDLKIRESIVPIAPPKPKIIKDVRIVLAIQVIGIEPNHQRKGFASRLVHRAEEIGFESGIDTILADGIMTDASRKMFSKLGYYLYDNGGYGVKRIR